MALTWYHTMVCSSVEAVSIRLLVREKLERILDFSSFLCLWETCAQSGQCPFNTEIESTLTLASEVMCTS